MLTNPTTEMRKTNVLKYIAYQNSLKKKKTLKTLHIENYLFNLIEGHKKYATNIIFNVE